MPSGADVVILPGAGMVSLIRAVGALGEAGIARYAIVGGVAVTIRLGNAHHQLPNPISKRRCRAGPHRRQIIRPLTPAVPHRHPDPTSDPRRDHHQQHQPVEQRADDGNLNLGHDQ